MFASSRVFGSLRETLARMAPGHHHHHHQQHPPSSRHSTSTSVPESVPESALEPVPESMQGEWLPAQALPYPTTALDQQLLAPPPLPYPETASPYIPGGGLGAAGGPPPSAYAGAIPLWRPEYMFALPAGELEPMCLLDTTGSMTFPTSKTDWTSRHDTVRKMMAALVGQLEGEDSQMAHEGGDSGGLRTVTFADGEACDLGDINTANLNKVWKGIKWRGETEIMPGWRKLREVYLGEFGNRLPKDRPALMVVLITDGEAKDLAEFDNVLAADLTAYVVVVVVGFGNEHELVMNSFARVAASNQRVRVIDFSVGVDPYNIARVLKRMVDPDKANGWE